MEVAVFHGLEELLGEMGLVEASMEGVKEDL